MKRRDVTLLTSQPISQSWKRGYDDGDSIPRDMTHVKFEGPTYTNDTLKW